MRNAIRTGVFLLTVAVGAGACANPEQWKEWKAHSSHFASGDHLIFSAKNQGQTPRVRTSDQRMASAQSWWGDPVLVRPDQIFQN
jgi:hypothetical protein